MPMFGSVSQNATCKTQRPMGTTTNSDSNNKLQMMATHEKKRKIAVKCLELEEMLENQGHSQAEIETKVASFRALLLKQITASINNNNSTDNAHLNKPLTIQKQPGSSDGESKDSRDYGKKSKRKRESKRSKKKKDKKRRRYYSSSSSEEGDTSSAVRNDPSCEDGKSGRSGRKRSRSGEDGKRLAEEGKRSGEEAEEATKERKYSQD